eukprot:6826316-Alexandrium_andersonii.AAC.1
MSASLVGSEMCIRDSLRASRSARSASASKRAARRRRGLRRARVPSDDCPVSYTHLTLPTICSV